MNNNKVRKLQNLLATRKQTYKKGSVPSGTTPPLNVLKQKTYLNSLVNQARSIITRKQNNNTTTFTSRIPTLNNIYPQKPNTFEEENPMISTQLPKGTIFEFIFVRHGESCANAIQKLGGTEGIKHKNYRDPELTQKGVEASEAKYSRLKGVLDSVKRDFTIGSSPLLRAQETAYFMLGKQTGKEINVYPFLGEIMLTPFKIGEKRRRIPGVSADNNPLSSIEQKSFLNKYQDPPFRKGEDLREPDYNPNFEKFLSWITLHKDLFPEVEGVRRIVIFTHSNLLITGFPYKTCLNKKELEKVDENKDGKLGNNDFLITIYKEPSTRIEGKSLLHPEAVYPNWVYYNTQDLNPEPECGLEPTRCKRMASMVSVPITKPCLAKGGKRKTRHLRRRRRSTRRRLH
jgi:hypothetical protein